MGTLQASTKECQASFNTRLPRLENSLKNTVSMVTELCHPQSMISIADVPQPIANSLQEIREAKHQTFERSLAPSPPRGAYSATVYKAAMVNSVPASPVLMFEWLSITSQAAVYGSTKDVLGKAQDDLTYVFLLDEFTRIKLTARDIDLFIFSHPISLISVQILLTQRAMFFASVSPWPSLSQTKSALGTGYPHPGWSPHNFSLHGSTAKGEAFNRYDTFNLAVNNSTTNDHNSHFFGSQKHVHISAMEASYRGFQAHLYALQASLRACKESFHAVVSKMRNTLTEISSVVHGLLHLQQDSDVDITKLSRKCTQEFDFSSPAMKNMSVLDVTRLTHVLSSFDSHIDEASMQGLLGVITYVPLAMELGDCRVRWKIEFRPKDPTVIATITEGSFIAANQVLTSQNSPCPMLYFLLQKIPQRSKPSSALVEDYGQSNSEYSMLVFDPGGYSMVFEVFALPIGGIPLSVLQFYDVLFGPIATLFWSFHHLHFRSRWA